MQRQKGEVTLPAACLGARTQATSQRSLALTGEGDVRPPAALSGSPLPFAPSPPGKSFPKANLSATCCGFSASSDGTQRTGSILRRLQGPARGACGRTRGGDTAVTSPFFALSPPHSPSPPLALAPHSSSWLGASIVPARLPAPLLLPSLGTRLPGPFQGAGGSRTSSQALLPHHVASTDREGWGAWVTQGPRLFLMPPAHKINIPPHPPAAQSPSFPHHSPSLLTRGLTANAFSSHALPVGLPRPWTPSGRCLETWHRQRAPRGASPCSGRQGEAGAGLPEPWGGGAGRGSLLQLGGPPL